MDETQLVAKAQAEKDYRVAITGTAVYAPGTPMPYMPGQPTEAMTHSWRLSRAEADYQWAVDYSAADLLWTTDGSDTDDTFRTDTADHRYLLDSATALREKNRAEPTALAAKEQALANALAENVFNTAVTTAANARRTAEYAAQGAWLTADYSSQATQIGAIANTVALPWANVEADLAGVRASWWNNTGLAEWNSLASELNTLDTSFTAALNNLNYNPAAQLPADRGLAFVTAQADYDFALASTDDEYTRTVAELAVDQTYEIAQSATDSAYQIEQAEARNSLRNGIANLWRDNADELDNVNFLITSASGYGDLQSENADRISVAEDRWKIGETQADGIRLSSNSEAQQAFIDAYGGHWRETDLEQLVARNEREIEVAAQQFDHDVAVADLFPNYQEDKSSGYLTYLQTYALSNPSPWIGYAENKHYAESAHNNSLSDAGRDRKVAVLTADRNNQIQIQNALGTRDEILLVSVIEQWQNREEAEANLSNVQASVLVDWAEEQGSEIPHFDLQHPWQAGEYGNGTDVKPGSDERFIPPPVLSVPSTHKEAEKTLRQDTAIDSSMPAIDLSSLFPTLNDSLRSRKSTFGNLTAQPEINASNLLNKYIGELRDSNIGVNASIEVNVIEQDDLSVNVPFDPEDIPIENLLDLEKQGVAKRFSYATGTTSLDIFVMKHIHSDGKLSYWVIRNYSAGQRPFAPWELPKPIKTGIGFVDWYANYHNNSMNWGYGISQYPYHTMTSLPGCVLINKSYPSTLSFEKVAQSYFEDIDLELEEGALQRMDLAVSMIPLFSAADNAKQGQYGEATISLAGDVAMFLGPMAKSLRAQAKLAKSYSQFAKSEKLFRKAAELEMRARFYRNWTNRLDKGARLIEGGVAVTRSTQAAVAFYNGDDEFYGYAGEALLRIYGVSMQRAPKPRIIDKVDSRLGTPQLPVRRLAGTQRVESVLEYFDDVIELNEPGLIRQLDDISCGPTAFEYAAAQNNLLLPNNWFDSDLLYPRGALFDGVPTPGGVATSDLAFGIEFVPGVKSTGRLSKFDFKSLSDSLSDGSVLLAVDTKIGRHFVVVEEILNVDGRKWLKIFDPGTGHLALIDGQELLRRTYDSVTISYK